MSNYHVEMQVDVTDVSLRSGTHDDSDRIIICMLTKAQDTSVDTRCEQVINSPVRRTTGGISFVSIGVVVPLCQRDNIVGSGIRCRAGSQK